MKITKVDIPKTPETNDGLEHIKMDRLEGLVLIAGKNGSGKTRILNKIFNTFSSKPKITRLSQSQSEIESHRRNLLSYEQQIIAYESQLASTTDEEQKRRIEQEISTYNNAIDSTNNGIKNCEYEQKWNFIETNNQSDNYASVRFVPKTLALQDSNSFPKSQIVSYASIFRCSRCGKPSSRCFC